MFAHNQFGAHADNAYLAAKLAKLTGVSVTGLEWWEWCAGVCVAEHTNVDQAVQKLLGLTNASYATLLDSGVVVQTALKALVYSKTSYQTAFAVVVGHPTVKHRNRYRSFTSNCFEQARHRSIAYHTGLQQWLTF